jgi:hypothetical protein
MKLNQSTNQHNKHIHFDIQSYDRDSLSSIVPNEQDF